MHDGGRELADVTKRFPGGAVALDGLSLSVPAGRDPRPPRHQRLRQDDGAQDDQPPRARRQRAGVRARPRRGELGPHRPAPLASATSSRRWASCPTSRWARTSPSSPPPRVGRRSGGAARARELLALVGLEPDRFAAALPAAALGRRAPARRPGPRPGRRSAAAPHGRAVRRARSAHAPPPAGRVQGSCSGGWARPSCSSPTTCPRRCASATASR